MCFMTGKVEAPSPGFTRRARKPPTFPTLPHPRRHQRQGFLPVANHAVAHTQISGDLSEGHPLLSDFLNSCEFVFAAECSAWGHRSVHLSDESDRCPPTDNFSWGIPAPLAGRHHQPSQSSLPSLFSGAFDCVVLSEQFSNFELLSLQRPVQ